MSTQTVRQGETRPRGDVSWLASCAAVELDALTRSQRSSLVYVGRLAEELSRMTATPTRPYSPAFLVEPITQTAMSRAITAANLHNAFKNASEILRKGSEIAEGLKGVYSKPQDIGVNEVVRLKKFCGALADELLAFEESAYLQEPVPYFWT